MVQQVLVRLRNAVSNVLAKILAEAAREHELAEREFKSDPRKKNAQALKGRLGRRL